MKKDYIFVFFRYLIFPFVITLVSIFLPYLPYLDEVGSWLDNYRDTLKLVGVSFLGTVLLVLIFKWNWLQSWLNSDHFFKRRNDFNEELFFSEEFWKKWLIVKPMMCGKL